MRYITGLDHLQLAMPAGKEAEARAFYGGLLGLVELEKPSQLAGRGGCWFALGTQALHLGVDTPFTPARKAHPAFTVSDLEALRERLEAANISMTPRCRTCAVFTPPTRLGTGSSLCSRVILFSSPPVF